MNETKVKLVAIWLCEACLNGEGQECHTPGCALFLHNSPGHPISEALYQEVQENTLVKAGERGLLDDEPGKEP